MSIHQAPCLQFVAIDGTVPHGKSWFRVPGQTTCCLFAKIIILVHRLRPILSRIISTSQGAFVQGRRDLDQIVVAQEVIHGMSRLKGSRAMVAVKLDVQKAYETISWPFLEACLIKLGFHSTFVIIADQLATCGAPVSEEDLILHTLSGLPFVYRPFQTSISTRSRYDSVSLEELHTLLVCEELSLVDDVTAESSTAFAASKSSFPQGRSTTTPNQYQRRSTGTTSRSSRTSSHRQNPSIDNQGQRQQPHGTSPASSRPRPQCQI
ncbi:hypothetical protein MRB53_031222 [Persea americana]|uniref:Uncharacterized protein n=1 Tax=Persea americana TaxID=3435 RepID=A0ACC2KP11_PERAE|nr:hypothetical protein MRB53_031222 [Persea americana]